MKKMITEKKIFYECNPEKNADCDKKGCQGPPGPWGPCRMTSDPLKAKTDNKGRPIRAAVFDPATGRFQIVEQK